LNELIEFLIQHGYILLFAWALIEQIGLPVPALPLDESPGPTEIRFS
jgi:hypothetical protein